MNPFPSRTGNDCFCVSLANLLLLQDEEELAWHVYETYHYHPLVHAGMHVALGLGTRIVRDLTGGKYQGFYTGWMGLDWREQVEQRFRDPAVLEAIADELDAGVIRISNRIEGFLQPALMIIQGVQNNGVHSLHTIVFERDEGETFTCYDAEEHLRVHKADLNYTGVLEVWPA